MLKQTESRIWRPGVGFLVICLLVMGTAVLSHGQPEAVPGDPQAPDEILGVTDPAAGTGVMVAGELWDSFMPANKGPYYEEIGTTVRTFIRLGNYYRSWSTPTHMWPGGWQNGNFWDKNIHVMEFTPDGTLNPRTIGGKTNPAYTADSNYVVLAYANNATNKVAGAGDPTRDYAKETYWVDATKRHHAVYEAGWPTNLGIDVKLKVHQWSLNWNNFNDFIVAEITFTNTGNVDINSDGTVERTGNAIRALTMMTTGEIMCSYNLGRNAGRANRFGAGRIMGYVGDNDPTGAPWDFLAVYPGESGTGRSDMGLNDYPSRFYTDVWSAWSWLGVKQGTDQNGPDKQTIYGTHPIGTGAERGWYASGGHGKGILPGQGSIATGATPRILHTSAMSAWYKDGGKSRDASKFDTSPDPNFFQSGTPGDPTTFVPKSTPARPRGDRKLYSEEIGAGAFETPTFESGWVKGFSAPENFDGDPWSGIGPFSLGVGESITVYWVEAGGFRFQGVANAISAARWAFANNWNVPDDYPAVPDMQVENTTRKTTKIRWDNRAEAAGSNFGGYKIYRAGLANRVNWLQTGTRVVDNYWKNMTPGPTPDTLKAPVNPSLNVAAAGAAGKFGVPDTWGPFELMKVIPAGQQSQYADNSLTGFNYSLEDPVSLGFKYWYYVAAYTAGKTYDLGSSWVSYPGTNLRTASFIETPHINVNGASGLWVDTYPWADLNPFYPKTAAGLKNIGAGFVAQSVIANPGDLTSGAVKISVKPNPYKKKALFDSAVDAFDHKVAFYNLPSPCTITILDVSGQIVQEIKFAGTTSGYQEWNMFSKNGVEVASGLYIYVVDYTGGQHVGYFSILR